MTTQSRTTLPLQRVDGRSLGTTVSLTPRDEDKNDSREVVTGQVLELRHYAAADQGDSALRVRLLLETLGGGRTKVDVPAAAVSIEWPRFDPTDTAAGLDGRRIGQLIALLPPDADPNDQDVEATVVGTLRGIRHYSVQRDDETEQRARLALDTLQGEVRVDVLGSTRTLFLGA